VTIGFDFGMNPIARSEIRAGAQALAGGRSFQRTAAGSRRTD
jgi:hypothetical protein